jgi:hypothetical protein
MNISLTEEEMGLLEKRYRHNDGTNTCINYTEFVKDDEMDPTKPN